VPKRIARVAIIATQVARGGAHENCGFTGEQTLALDTVENLVNFEGGFRHRGVISQPSSREKGAWYTAASEDLMLAALTAAFHYLALGLGLGSVFMRGRYIRALRTASVVERKEVLGSLFVADNIWGLAAFLWVATGLARAFGGFEKGTAFYLSSHLFFLKMALFLGVLALEIPPMITFIKWRISLKKGQEPARIGEPVFLRRLYQLNTAEAVIVVLIPLVASLMARGIGSH
jgi:putative membrane protein